MNTNPHTEFGDWLSERAIEGGFTTQEELATAVDVSGPTVSRWLSGKKLPLLENMRPLASALSVSTLELYVRAGWIEEKEAGGLPERAPLDPRLIPAVQALRRIDRLPPTQKAILEDQLATGLRLIIEGLDNMARTFSDHLRLPMRTNEAHSG